MLTKIEQRSNLDIILIGPFLLNLCHSKMAFPVWEILYYIMWYEIADFFEKNCNISNHYFINFYISNR